MAVFSYADVEEQCLKDTNLKKEDVTKLDEWQRMQPHLPTPLHPIESALFLHSCYYSNEAAKKCMECFYTCRKYYPEFLNNMDPFSPELQQGMDSFTIVVLPDLTPEGYMVLYGTLKDSNPDVYNFNTAMKIADLMISLELKQRGCYKGHILVIDLSGIKMMHFLKTSPITVKRGADYMQNAMPIRLKSLHFVNSVPFMDKVMSLVKPFLKKEILDVLHIHFGDNSTIFKYVPKEILPIECGGSQFSASDYFTNIVRKDVERHAEFLKQEGGRMLDESKLPRKTNITELMGVDGTFKSLDID